MALRNSRLGIPELRLPDWSPGRYLPESRLHRSALLIALYIAAFFPLSSLPGAAAQFFSLVPVSIAASLLGLRGGLIVGFGFVPLLIALTTFAQGEPWDYMLFEGRPAALISLIAMAGVAGRARDLADCLALEKAESAVHLGQARQLAGDRARVISLGVQLASAHSQEAVFRAIDSVMRGWFEYDRMTYLEFDREVGLLRPVYVSDLEDGPTGEALAPGPGWTALVERARTGDLDPHFGDPLDQPQPQQDVQYTSELCMPLAMRGDVTGFLSFLSTSESAYDSLDAALLQTASQQLAPHIRAAALFDSTVRESQLRSAQSEVAHALSMTSGLEPLLKVAGEQFEALVPIRTGIIAEAKTGSRELTVRHTFGTHPGVPEEGDTFEWSDDFVFLDDRVRYLDLPAGGSGEEFLPFSALAHNGNQDVAITTLISKGEVVGWIALTGTSRQIESEFTSLLLQALSTHVANGLVRERVEQEQNHLLERLAGQNTELRSARGSLQKSQAELELRNSELQQAGEAKTRFLSAVSHELKTPLAIMVGFAELLGMNLPQNLTNEQIEQVRIVERNGRHLDLLVSDLVDISRIESGRLSVSPVPTQPARLLEETLEGLEKLAADKRQQIVRDIEIDSEWVRMDPARVGQVITNLVTNAFKYSPEAASVTITARIDRNDFEIVVSDEGIGISDADQQELFTPFFRSTNDKALEEKGTGLGLVITRSIVELHGGTLGLQSRPGEGTVVTVSMPGVMNSPPSEAMGQQRGEPDAPATGTGRDAA